MFSHIGITTEYVTHLGLEQGFKVNPNFQFVHLKKQTIIFLGGRQIL